MSNREVMQQALEALEIGWSTTYTGKDARELGMKAITALKAALAEFDAEPTKEEQTQIESKQEPVAWLIKWVNANDGVPQGEWQRGYDAARNVVRAHLKAAQQVVNQEMTTEQCPCGDRPAAECPGEWEPGCDLGANEAHAKVYEPVAEVVKAARGVLSWTELAHRPPVRDTFETGRMVGVRLHALADLHGALTALAAAPAHYTPQRQPQSRSRP